MSQQSRRYFRVCKARGRSKSSSIARRMNSGSCAPARSSSCSSQHRQRFGAPKCPPSAPQVEQILNTTGALVPEGLKVPSISAAGGENFEHLWRFGAVRPQSALLQLSLTCLRCKRDLIYFHNGVTYLFYQIRFLCQALHVYYYGGKSVKLHDYY